MSNTPNIDKLNSLQKRAATLSASGLSDPEVRDALALSIGTYETWRQDAVFVAAIAEVKARDTDASTAAFDLAADEMAQ